MTLARATILGEWNLICLVLTCRTRGNMFIRDAWTWSFVNFGLHTNLNIGKSARARGTFRAFRFAKNKRHLNAWCYFVKLLNLRLHQKIQEIVGFLGKAYLNFVFTGSVTRPPITIPTVGPSQNPKCSDNFCQQECRDIPNVGAKCYCRSGYQIQPDRVSCRGKT